MRAVLAGVLSVALLIAACGDEPPGPVVNDLQLIVLDGDGQVGRCYAELPMPVTVAVRDSSRGALIPDHTVDFHVLEGGGSVQDTAVVSDSRGLAANLWTLGAPGPQLLEARAAGTGLANEVSVRLTATAEDTQEVRLVTQTTQHNPFGVSVSGDRIVWTEYRDGGFNIFMYDLASETEQRITSDSAVAGIQPVISGERIAWADWRHGPPAIYLYDLTTQTERRITMDSGYREAVTISGDHIAWLDYRHATSTPIKPEIYSYDLATGIERRITADTVGQSAPAISGDRMVWSSECAVHLYDLASDTERRISTTLSCPSGPQISGDRIVWSERDPSNGWNWEIFLYDVASETARRITTEPRDQQWPHISGNRIVWSQWVGHWDVYLYDLTTDVARRVATDAWNPTVAGDHVVWQDNKPGYPIYLAGASVCTPPAP